jgi:hypothetical protein
MLDVGSLPQDSAGVSASFSQSSYMVDLAHRIAVTFNIEMSEPAAGVNNTCAITFEVGALQGTFQLPSTISATG